MKKTTKLLILIILSLSVYFIYQNTKSNNIKVLNQLISEIHLVLNGVGENNIPVRREICEKLSCLGVKIDLDKNNVRGETVKISSDDSAIDVYVIPTDEELMIARETIEIIKNR